MSQVQGPDEGDQGPHLPPAAKVEMPEMRHGQDAEAKGEVLLVIRAAEIDPLSPTALGWLAIIRISAKPSGSPSASPGRSLAQISLPTAKAWPSVLPTP